MIETCSDSLELLRLSQILKFIKVARDLKSNDDHNVSGLKDCVKNLEVFPSSVARIS